MVNAAPTPGAVAARGDPEDSYGRDGFRERVGADGEREIRIGQVVHKQRQLHAQSHT